MKSWIFLPALTFSDGFWAFPFLRLSFPTSCRFFLLSVLVVNFWADILFLSLRGLRLFPAKCVCALKVESACWLGHLAGNWFTAVCSKVF